MTPWAEYRPTAANPWTPAKAGHLFRRAGFGTTAAEVAEATAAGPHATVDKLLAGGADAEGFAATSDYLAGEKALPKGASGGRLAAWWVARMLHSPHPLREKLTLFWHNHFATSLTKVRDAWLMLGQYRLLNQHALGDFRELLAAMSTDPAMMVWLDTAQSVRGKPNENYARELMELFSLGVGNYTETDVREAARAFTGYELRDGKATLNPKKHDSTAKKVLGRTGDFAADDVVNICLGQPACPRFVARKLYRFLVSDAADPAPALTDPLADQYRKSGFDTAKLVETILRSDHFFGPAAYRRKVKSPVEYALGIVRGLGGSPGALPLAEALEPLGQALFAPPSVKGWDGGPAWLNGQTLLFRQNLALSLVSGDDARFGTRCDPVPLLGDRTGDVAVDHLLAVFLQGDVPAAARARLCGYLADPPKPPRYWSADEARTYRLRAVTHLTLTLPEFQLN